MPKVNDLKQFILMERQQRNNLAAFNLLAKKDDPVEELKGYLNSNSGRSNIFHINDLKYGQPTESDLKTMVAKLKLLQTSFDELSIPTPFKNSTEEVDIELKFVRMLRKLTENPDTIQDIEEEDRDLLSPFLRFTQAKHLPVDEAFLRLLIDDINAITMRFKYMFNRPRPTQLAAQKDLELVAHDGSSAHSPSYPSGHAVAGRVLSRALSDKYPDFAEDFQRIGAAIGLNRLIAGLHYPTDHAAGVMLADQLYTKGLVKDHTNFMMPDSEDFVRAVQAAITKHAEGFNLNKSIDDMSVLVDIFKAEEGIPSPQLNRKDFKTDEDFDAADKRQQEVLRIEEAKKRAAGGSESVYDSKSDSIKEVSRPPQIPEDTALADEQRNLTDQLSILRNNQANRATTVRGKEDSRYKEYEDFRAEEERLETAIEDVKAQREKRLSGFEGAGTSADDVKGTRAGLSKPDSGFEVEQTKARDWVDSSLPNIEAALERSHKPTHYLVMNPSSFRSTVGVDKWNSSEGRYDKNRKRPGITIEEQQILGTLVDAETGEPLEGDELTEYLKQRNSPTYDTEGLSMVTVVQNANPKVIQEALAEAEIDIHESAFENFKNWVALDAEADWPKHTMNTSNASISDVGGGTLRVGFESGDTVRNMVYDLRAKLRALASGFSYAGRKPEETLEAGSSQETQEQMFDSQGQGEKSQALDNLLGKLSDIALMANSIEESSEIRNLVTDQYNEHFERVLRGTDLSFIQGKGYGKDDPQYERDLLSYLETEIMPVNQELAEMDKQDTLARIADFREKYAYEISTLNGDLNAPTTDTYGTPISKKELAKRRGQAGRFEDMLDRHSYSDEALKGHLMFSGMTGAFIANDRDTGEPKFLENNLAGFIRQRRGRLKTEIKDGYKEKFQEPIVEEPAPPEETPEDFAQRVQSDSRYNTDGEFRERVDGELVDLERTWKQYNESPNKAVWDEYNNRPTVESLLAGVDTQVLENPKYFLPSEEVKFNTSGLKIYERLFLGGSSKLPMKERYNQVVRGIQAGSFEPKAVLDKANAAKSNLSTNPVRKNDLDAFASMFDISGIDAVFGSRTLSGEATQSSNDLNEEGRRFFRVDNFPEYASLLSGLGDRKKALIDWMELKVSTKAELEDLKPKEPLRATMKRLRDSPYYGEDGGYTDRAEKEIAEARESWEQYDAKVDERQEASDNIDKTLQEEFYDRAKGVPFKTSHGVDAEPLGEVSGKIKVVGEDGTESTKHRTPNELNRFFREDFIGAVNNASWYERDPETNKLSAKPLFSGVSATGEVRRLSHDSKLQHYSGVEQGINRHLIEAEKSLVDYYFPYITDRQQFGGEKPGDQGLEGGLEALRRRHFGGDYEDTKEEGTSPITAKTYDKYLTELQELLHEFKEGKSFVPDENSGTFTIPESIVEGLERSEENAEYREGRTSKDREVGGAPRSKVAGREVNQEEPIEGAKKAGFSFGGKQQLDPMDEAEPVVQVTAERDPNPEYTFPGQLPFNVNDPFDPYADVPTKKHNTLQDRVASSASKATKRPNVVTDPAKLTPMAPVTQESTGMSPDEVEADRTAKKPAVEARMAPKQQGTENGS